MSVHHYRGMLVQPLRMEAFRAAVEAYVSPGDRVLEIGTGLGTYAMFAARAGAGKVWAVEGGPVAWLARDLVRDNGLADQVEVLRGWYPEMAPDEPVSLAIYEDYAARLLDVRSHGILRHLHRAGLSPGGRVLPSGARVWLCPVHAGFAVAHVHPLGRGDDRLHGLDWSASRSYVANGPLPVTLRPEHLVHEPREVARVGFLPPPGPDELAGSAVWRFDVDTEIHGVAYWFDLEVGTDVWLSNAPGADPGSWGHLLLPTHRPLRVEAGAELRAGVGFDAEADGSPGWMRWEVSAGGERSVGHEFRTFLGGPGDLRRVSPDWLPALSAAGRAARRVLELADGTMALRDLAATLEEEGLADSRHQAEQLVSRALEGRTE